MGSLNIAEWTPEQVADWLTGLGPKVAQYVPELQKKALNGSKLLTMRCDDLEYLGVHIIGHQELILEAVEHLRNFHYESSRECVQQLAVRVSGAAQSLARALRYHGDARLETDSLADVARTVHAVKPLVCWLDRWPLCSGSPLAARKAALLKLSLEAATCAQRERFAEQPARAVAAAAAALAALADYIIQDVSDPMILQPARVDSVSLVQGERALGFEVVPSFCGHHQLAHIRFASPAHASGLVHEADEIVQVGGRCVVGWPGEAVEAACTRAARSGDLALKLRRRGARALPALPTPPLRAPRARARPRAPHAPFTLHRYELEFPLSGAVPPARRSPPRPARADSPSSEDSDALSPPASPTLLLLPDTARMYPPKPRLSVVRRHSVSGETPAAASHALAVHQLWQQLQQQRLACADGDNALYRRDKAVSCSTGLQLSPRPRTCLVVPRPLAPPAASPCRGKLDKSHSTPAYDFEPSSEPGSLAAQTIPESPTTPVTDGPHTEKEGQILDFKKSSSQIEEAIQQRNRRANGDEDKNDGFTEDDTKLEIVETVNEVMRETGGGVRDRGREDARRRREAAADDTSSDDQQAAPTMRQTKPRITERFRPVDPSRPPSPPPRPSLPHRPAPPAPREPRPPPRDAPQYPPVRVLPRPTESRDASPLKALRPEIPQASVPLRHITKHDIKLVSAERRELPAINGEAERAAARKDDVTVPAASPGGGSTPGGAGVPRGLFPSSKARSLKKKNSLLVKRRSVPARLLAGRGACGSVVQRVRAGAGPGCTRWAARHLLLAHNLLYAYRSAECSRAACMIYLEGFTVCAAAEVKSRAHAFKVYHTGTAFYFACDSREAMLAWIGLIHRATLLPSLLSEAMELSKQFSETDYSETESDLETSERRMEKEKEREKEREKEKSKFGSLKKLTHRTSRSDSQENVSQQAATSLDRKYLRFFSRARAKDDSKTAKKPSGVPVPTEHYRSYRRAEPPLPSPRGPPPRAPRLLLQQ
ncbi:unnamed protein product [Danaus chrysippus]|uniref:(African queen) hypothetical protein n=1 Tax=Danaus chrysippus TaxID=151541 RepID=A0A8J2QE30_9NEOP|nr:unnamed protein product [Danaus chrysippus]